MGNPATTASSTEVPDELSSLLDQLRQTMGKGGSVEEFQTLLAQLSAAQANIDAALAAQTSE
jgi:hypothetical protein